MRKRLRVVVCSAVLKVAALVLSIVDRVQLEGDHVAYLVIAPHLTLRFAYDGGADGPWKTPLRVQSSSGGWSGDTSP